MKALTLCLLPAAISLTLANSALAQDDCIEVEDAKAGLYATTDEGRTFLIKEGEMVELGPGDSGFADESGVKCLKKPPEFLNWPCATQAAQSRMFSTYSLDDVTSGNRMEEIVKRYFEVPEVIAPIPNWIDGEFHGTFSYGELIQYSNDEYWYHLAPGQPYLSPKRPRSLQVSLYVGLNKVVIDRNALEALRQELGGDQIPVTFVFNDSNVVPVSYFGANVSLEEIRRAFFERGIKLADVPQWWLGDYHLQPTIAEFEQFFEIPPLDSIPADKQQKIRAELEQYAFTRKPLIVSVLSDTGTMVVDQPERLRVAASMGFERIPTSLFFVEPDMVLARCGPGTPAGYGNNSISGETTPPGGGVIPPGSGVTPQPPDPDASDS